MDDGEADKPETQPQEPNENGEPDVTMDEPEANANETSVADEEEKPQEAPENEDPEAKADDEPQDIPADSEPPPDSEIPAEDDNQKSPRDEQPDIPKEGDASEVPVEGQDNPAADAPPTEQSPENTVRDPAVESDNPENKPADEETKVLTGDMAKNSSEEVDKKDEQGDEEEVGAEETEVMRKRREEKPKLPEDFFYDIEELYSRPKITEDSGLPEKLVTLFHSFGFDCQKRDNVHLLDNENICFVAGNLVQLVNINTMEQKYLRSTSGGGIGAITIHPSAKYFAVAEKGEIPNVIVYEYPSLKLYRILRGGTQEAYSHCKFSPDGELLATVGSDPDYMLTVWDWKNEQTVLRSKAFSQDVFRVSWSADLEGILTTSGTGHIRFWKMANTFTGLKLQGAIGKFGKTEISDIEGFVELPDGKVLSGCEWGNLLVWDGGLIKVQICRKGKKSCHAGPIQQIIMDEGELMTVGIDGFIRTWDFETIDTAEAMDESAIFELEPMNEMQVDADVRLLRIVKSFDEDSTIWFAQDANGHIWKLDLSFSHTSQAPEKIASFHAGPIVDCDTSPLSYLAASIGQDGGVRVFDFANKKVLAKSTFTGEGTKIIWAPTTVDPKGKTIISGFSDGVVRVLNFGENPETDATRKARHFTEIALVQAIKPHTQAVSALAIDKEGETLCTGGRDSTVFFFSIDATYEPIGFVTVEGIPERIEWLDKTSEETESGLRGRVIVYMAEGKVYEVPCPEPNRVDHSKTYQLTEVHPSQEYQFTSVKSNLRREEELEKKRIEDEKRKKLEEKARKERLERGLETEEEQKAQMEEEMKLKQKEEEEWIPYIPSEPSPILNGFVDKKDPSKFWISMGEYDAGYLYQCEFASDEKKASCKPDTLNEPVRSVPMTSTADVPVTQILFSRTGMRALMASKDGRICVEKLESEWDLSSATAQWTLSMHDNHYGQVNAISTSFDDKFILTVGADGNFFVYEFMDEVVQDEQIEEYKVRVPSARKFEVSLANDIQDPKAYSIEEHKQKSEHDRMVKLAEEKKAATRRKIFELRKEFKTVKEKNEALPERISLAKKEFEMVPELRQDLNETREEKIRNVNREMAWESEKQKIALNKLKKRFRDYVECDRVVVKSFQSTHEVATIRAVALSDNFHELKKEIEMRRAAQEKKDMVRDQTRTSMNKGDQEGEDTATADVTKTKATVGGARGERIARQLKKLEERKRKRAARKAEWEILFSTKPDDDYEDPKDIQAIQEAKEKMGDFKLKSSSDYIVPDHLRMNTDKARQRLLEIESQMYHMKKSYNTRVLNLRDRKLAIIDEIKGIITDISNLQTHLPNIHDKPLPEIPDIHPDEIPESKFEYTQASLIAFKKDLEERRLAKIKGEEATSGGFVAPTAKAAAPQGNAPLPTRPSRNAQQPGWDEDLTSSNTGAMASQNLTHSSLQRDFKEAQTIRCLYERDQLFAQYMCLLRNFDAQLRLVRHDKGDLDTRLKKAELRQLTLYEEFQLLREFEKSERVLAERAEVKLKEKEEMASKVIDVQSRLDSKKKDTEKLQEREKVLHEQFKVSLGENNKFADYLTKVFKKKIKRKKKENEGDDSDDSDESSDDDDSEWDESEEDSDEEGVVYDLDMCPPGCDQTLYDGTCQLREKRLDIEDELTEEKKVFDVLRKEVESLQKKSKIIESSLKQAENELEAFQLEKQQKLNELDMIVLLKFNQLLYHENGQLPSDLSQVLIFERANLINLRKRIHALEEEKLEQRRQQKEAKKRHIQLMKNRKLFQARISETQETCDQYMYDKFGKIDDLERLESVIINPKIEELTEKMLLQQAEMLKEQEEWEDRIREAKNRLIEQTQDNTKFLNQMLMLYTEKKELEKKLDSKQKNLGAEYQTTRPADLEEIARLMQLVQIQAQELNALKEEIGMLSRKGGHILPPVQAPSMPNESSTIM